MNKYSFRKKLLIWYKKEKRDLPWRKTLDPYSVWLSEVMLQQTQVKTMLPYYHRFKKRFPTLEKLAKASIDQVLPYWSGLGYYRRIHHFHIAAGDVIKNNKGIIPKDVVSLKKLHGVGEYMSHAISSIAFGQNNAVVDGNIERVYARIFSWEKDPKLNPLKSLLKTQSQAFCDPKNPGDFNQAIMDLGAMVCLPKNPQCSICPIQSGCMAFSKGIQNRLPVNERIKPRENQNGVSILVEQKGKILIQQRINVSVMNGLWEIPSISIQNINISDKKIIKQMIPSGLKLSSTKKWKSFKHSIMNKNINQIVYFGELQKNKRSSKYFQWINGDQYRDKALTGLTKKIIKERMK